MDLLDSRLQNLGASGYYFVKLDSACHDKDDGDEEKKDGGCIGSIAGPTAVSAAAEPVHVKTLIWEAVLVVRSSSGSGRIIEEIVDHHFVTALRVEDRVDLQRLYDLVKEHTLGSLSSDENVDDDQRRLLLRLAGRDVAEELVGYQSGTMPPIAHSTSMPLYIDDTIASMSSSMSFVSVGAGDLQYDLYMPTDEMIRVANISSSSVHVGPLSLQKPKSKEPNCCKETSSKLGQITSAKSQIHQIAATVPEEASSEIEEEMAKAKGKLERANILRKAAKKKGNAEVLRRMLDAIGNEFPELMECEEYGFGGIDKNALHTAAWKGDLETITLLIEKGNAFDLDLVNTVSMGSGNYGKTPIFYALTQCREDAVLLLIANGADLLFVNNKGQSPCSIAVSHLKPEVCQIMYDVEASQLQNGGIFKNYRKSHSDGRSYGDLDPRFEIDDDNMNESVQQELEEYNRLLRNATDTIDCGAEEDGDAEYEERYKLLQSTMIPGLPRSIAETTRHWNIPHEERNEKSTTKGKKKEEKLKRNDEQRKASKRAQMKTSMEEDDDINYDALEPLSFESSVFDGNHLTIVVDDEVGVSELSKAIDECTSGAAIAADTARRQGLGKLSDDDIIVNSFALDCEWQPSYQRGYETPVATLQLHHTASNKSFLVDVQCLLQASMPDANTPMSDVEHRLSDALTKLFADRNVALLGFGVAQDLGKLAASFPHLPCFRRFESVIDLHTVSRNVFAGTPKHHMSSLQKMVAVLLGLSLDKKEQCSDWQQRPLTESQLSYALIDAAILPILLRSMLVDRASGVTDQFEGFLLKHPHLLTTTKLTCLGAFDDVDQYACPPQLAYRVPYGSCKVHLQHVMARQIFMTGNEDPAPPEILPLETQQKIAYSRLPKEKKAQKKVADSNAVNDAVPSKRKVKMKTIKLHTVSADFSNLPEPSEIIGYTKDSCIHKVLGQEFIDSLSENNTRLGFNRRGGVLPLENSFCLFINFALSEAGTLPSSWLYRNDFLDDGRRLTFTVNSERAHEKALVDFFSEHGKSNENKKVLLFARTSTQTKFMYCGELACQIRELGENEFADDNFVNLVLELMDYDDLVVNSSTGEPSAFVEMVSSHTAALAMERELLTSLVAKPE